MDKYALKERICTTIDKYRDDIINIGNEILNNPEMGFKEIKTANRVKEVFKSLDLEYETGLALTGLKTILNGKSNKFKIAVIGEMDAVICPSHPLADPITGAAHCCGHNAQIASMLGVAYGLIKSGVMSELDGDVAFMAVPAEEFVELEYREHLKSVGKYSFLEASKS